MNFRIAHYLEKFLPLAHVAIEQEIEENLERVSSNCERLAILINKEPPQKKQSARM